MSTIVHTTHSSLVAVNVLPDELLGYIFVLLLDSLKLPNEKVDVTAKVQLVCQKWKRVAVITPEFWRFIDVAPECHVLQSLEYSGAVTLDVAVYVPWVPEVEDLFIAVCSHATRWRSLQLMVPNVDSLPLFLDLLPTKTPHLSHIRIIDYSQTIDGPASTCFEAPALQLAYLKALTFGPNLISKHWVHLQELILDELHCVVKDEILEWTRLPFLETLAIKSLENIQDDEEDGISWPTPQGQPIGVFRRLRRLVLLDTSVFPVMTLLSLALYPELDTLILDTVTPDEPFPDRFLPLVSPPLPSRFPSLRNIAIFNDDADMTQVYREILQAASRTLRTLTFVERFQENDKILLGIIPHLTSALLQVNSLSVGGSVINVHSLRNVVNALPSLRAIKCILLGEGEAELQNIDSVAALLGRNGIRVEIDERAYLRDEDERLLTFLPIDFPFPAVEDHEITRENT